jgi:hypothetical protein
MTAPRRILGTTGGGAPVTGNECPHCQALGIDPEDSGRVSVTITPVYSYDTGSWPAPPDGPAPAPASDDDRYAGLSETARIFAQWLDGKRP